MTRALIILTALVTGFALAQLLPLRQPPRVYVSRIADAMGAPLEVRIEAESPARAREAELALRAEIDRDGRLLSRRDPGSEVNRWLRSSAVVTKISPELSDVLASFDDWRTRTQGAVDPAVAAARGLWQRAAERNRIPTRHELRTALAQIRQTHWVLDRATSTATHTSDVPLGLGSLAKAYVFDRAARAGLSVSGVSGVLLSAGNRTLVRGTWTQTVPVAEGDANAEAELAISDAAVVVRFADRRGFDIGGRHYSPQIDPRSGEPVSQAVRVAVIAANPVTADAMATAFCILTPSESMALAASMPGVEFSITLAGGRRIDSPGWRAFDSGPREIPGTASETVLAAAHSLTAAWLLERYL